MSQVIHAVFEEGGVYVEFDVNGGIEGVSYNARAGTLATGWQNPADPDGSPGASFLEREWNWKASRADRARLAKAIANRTMTPAGVVQEALRLANAPKSKSSLWVVYGSICNRRSYDVGIRKITEDAHPDNGVPAGQFLIGVYVSQAEAEGKVRAFRAYALDVIARELDDEEGAL